MKRLLVAVDGSEASLNAVQLAAELAAKFEGELMLIDVVENGSPSDWALAKHTRLNQVRGDMGLFAQSFARDALQTASARALAHGAEPSRSELRFGDAAEEVLKFGEETAADAIVVGSRGRGRLAGILLGSISQKIATRAPCTVVIAR